MSFSRFTSKRPAFAACFCCEHAKPRGMKTPEGKPEKRCSKCIEAECVEGHAGFWKRGEACPVRARAKRGASFVPRKERAS